MHIDTVAITQPSVILLTANSTPAACSSNTGTATATPSGGTAPYTHSWNTSPIQTTQTATGLATGNYTVTVTDANSCTQTQTVIVTQTSNLTALITATSNSLTIGESTQLIATGGDTYSWSPINGLSCTTCANPTATPTATTDYCVFVTDANGCTDSACITISVEIACGEVFVPEAFSPNNDLANDLECVFGNCIQDFYFAIYDRWGETVFETTDQKNCWNGTYKGKSMNTAVFVYYLKATLLTGEQINKKGNITLIR